MTAPSSASLHLLVQRIDQLLPQTQCQRCGYEDCHGYASALARGETDINRCPPGQEHTIINLSRLLRRPRTTLAEDLAPMPARQVVRIQPENCIGCTKCILACPVDAIVGAPKFLHEVLADRCTGCERCLPPCPTDCIEVHTLDAPWKDADATRGRQHHQRRNRRLESERQNTRRPHAPAPAMQETGTAPAPVTPPRHDDAHLPTDRDPLVALSDADEKARRLAAIRARLGQTHPANAPRSTGPRS